MILSDFLKALGQLPDPTFRSVLWRGVGLTIALFIGAYAGLLWLIEALTSEPVVLPNGTEVTWLGDLLGWGSLLLMLLLSVFLMVPVASAITSLFLDEVADAVEAEHYPDLAPSPPEGFWEGLRTSLSFLGLLLVANLLAFFAYAMLPFLAIFIFFGLNGYLLAREYFQMAAARRIGREAAREMWQDNRVQIWAAGCLMAMPLTVPLVNLFIPVLGAATFTHLFHRLYPPWSATSG